MANIPIYGRDGKRLVKFSDMLSLMFDTNGWNSRLIKVTMYSYTNIPTVYLYIGNRQDVDAGNDPITLVWENISNTFSTYIMLRDLQFEIGDQIIDYWRLVIDSQTSAGKRVTFELRNNASSLLALRELNTNESVIQFSSTTDSLASVVDFKNVYYINLYVHP